MKINFLTFSIFIFLSASFAGCNFIRESKHYIIQLKPSDDNPRHLQAAVSIIDARLKTVYKDDAAAKLKGNYIELELHEKVNVKDLLYLVLSRGRFSLREVHDDAEIARRILKIDEQGSAIGFLTLSTFHSNTGVIGVAGRYDTAEITHSRTIQTLQRQYNDLQLLWGRETRESTIPLYAVKNDNSIFTNQSIKSAIVDIDERGMECVAVELKEDFHRGLLHITRRNMSKPIALCLDNNVLSAPIVVGEIPNGRLVISYGPDGDARLVAALLGSNVLPMSLSVSSIDSALHDAQREPTKEQIAKYNVLQMEYRKYRHSIDSQLRQSPGGTDVGRLRLELGRVYHQSLPSIVEEVGLTKEQVDEFLKKMSGTMDGFKAALEGNPVRTQQSFLDSLSALPSKQVE
jgi:hypothetical protein